LSDTLLPTCCRVRQLKCPDQPKLCASLPRLWSPACTGPSKAQLACLKQVRWCTIKNLGTNAWTYCENLGIWCQVRMPGCCRCCSRLACCQSLWGRWPGACALVVGERAKAARTGSRSSTCTTLRARTTPHTATMVRLHCSTPR